MRVRKTSRDEAWLEAACSDTDTLLSDHAHCEKKAAASAIAMIQRYPEFGTLVAEMAELAQEEMGHFAEVHAQIVARGGQLAPDIGDPYVKALLGELKGNGRQERMAERLLASALVEARSFERLRLLGEHHPDATLREMWARFAVSEARHGATFVRLARELGPGRAWADARLAELEDFEHAWLEAHPVRCAIH